MKWFEDLSSYLLKRGYESVVTGDDQLVIFGPKHPDKEMTERIKWTKPPRMEYEVRVGLLQSTLILLGQSFGRALTIEDYKGSVSLTLDARLVEGTEECEVVSKIDSVLARDKYPWRYTIIIGSKSWVRYPSLVSDFADHNRHVDMADLRIVLATSGTVEEFLAHI